MYSSIKVLSQQLYNQIAAGEIIERPASVVKELVENSLDAGAMHISIDIELGGMKMIRIRDNGCGIRKNELGLALTSHATSKIYSMDDLENITSMGFRGEALASISSVSRLILTSRTVDQKEAWQAYSEGSNIIYYLKPAAHPVGTTVEVLDLFFNIPARRKFMHTVKNEFFNIDEVIRSIALSRFDVTFILQHNGKIVRKYFGVVISSNKEQNMRRLSSLCRPAFVERALEVSFKDEDLFIHGWLENPAIAGSNLSKIQYIYINNRITFDIIIKNTIIQVYNELLIITHKPAFVLFLDLDPYKVDVNVHPSKNIIRFRQLRKVQDFIYNAVFNILKNKCKDKNIYKIVNNNFMHLYKYKEDTNIQQQQYYNKKNIKNKNFDNYKFENKDCINEILCLDNKNIENLFSYNNIITAAQENKKKIDIKEYRNELLDSTLLSSFNNNIKKISKLLTIYQQHYALIESVYGNICLLSLQVAYNYLKEQQLIPQNGKSLYAYPILIPPRITIDNKQSESIKNNKKLLNDMGIILKLYDDQVIIKAVPLSLRDQNFIKLIPELLYYMNNKLYLTYKQIALWLTNKINCNFDKVWNDSQAIKLLLDIDMFYPQWFIAPPKNFLVIFNLKDAIKTLNNE